MKKKFLRRFRGRENGRKIQPIDPIAVALAIQVTGMESLLVLVLFLDYI